MNGCDVALATYERRVLQLFKARRWSRAWKTQAKWWRLAWKLSGRAAMQNHIRIAELEDALRPFAKLGDELPTGPDWELDKKPVWSFNNAVITLGQLRHARKVLDHE